MISAPEPVVPGPPARSSVPIARWKDLCLDALDPQLLGPFYGTLLDLRVEQLDDGDVCLHGPTPGHRIWVNRVPEPRSVKNRVHLDINVAAVDDALALGARLLDEFEGWTVLADPEDGEFCVFVRDADALAGHGRLYEISIDSVDAGRQARWWAALLGGYAQYETDQPTDTEASTGTDTEEISWWVVTVPDAPFDGLVFVDVPEPRVGKNRVHLDLLADPAAVAAAGATVLTAPGPGRPWTVLADPEGNEFCVFPESDPDGDADPAAHGVHSGHV